MLLPFKIINEHNIHYLWSMFSYVDAQVGLENTSYIVNENNIIVVEICACVFEPVDTCPIDFAFNLHFLTIAGSAGILLMCEFINFVTLYKLI